MMSLKQFPSSKAKSCTADIAAMSMVIALGMQKVSSNAPVHAAAPSDMTQLHGAHR